jgi:hypothetical protein
VTPLSRAFVRVARIYESRGIRLVLERFNNDIVRNTYHWSCRQLFDHLLSADIHILATHLHQGMLALGGTETWNTMNILTNMQRLRYHLGANCGIFIDDCVANQDKMGYYGPLQKEGLCAPTIAVGITCSSGDISPSDKNRIERFVITSDCHFLYFDFSTLMLNDGMLSNPKLWQTKLIEKDCLFEELMLFYTCHCF